MSRRNAICKALLVSASIVLANIAVIVQQSTERSQLLKLNMFDSVVSEVNSGSCNLDTRDGLLVSELMSDGFITTNTFTNISSNTPLQSVDKILNAYDRKVAVNNGTSKFCRYSTVLTPSGSSKYSFEMGRCLTSSDLNLYGCYTFSNSEFSFDSCSFDRGNVGYPNAFLMNINMRKDKEVVFSHVSARYYYFPIYGSDVDKMTATVINEVIAILKDVSFSCMTTPFRVDPIPTIIAISSIFATLISLFFTCISVDDEIVTLRDELHKLKREFDKQVGDIELGEI